MPEELVVAVTGGSGFIAGDFITHLLGNRTESGSMKVRALVSSSEGLLRVSDRHIGAVAMRLDQVGHGGLVSQLEGAHVLVHAGWSTVPATADRDPLADLQENVAGSLRLFQAGIKAGVRRIVFISSGGTVYGEAEHVPLAETHPVRPMGAYGAAKLLVERYLSVLAAQGSIEHVILRPANVYGRHRAHEKPQGVIEHWLLAALHRQEVVSWTDLDAERDFLHVDDMVSALACAITQPIVHPLLNVGTGRATSLRRIKELIEETTGFPLRMIESSTVGPQIRRNALDGRRIQSDWGWKPSVSVEEGIRRTCGVLRATR
jgi:UDP-glucose 4-epimerase